MTAIFATWGNADRGEAYSRDIATSGYLMGQSDHLVLEKQ
ncbi:hypothetical protein FHS26_006044 [Rhizobium pisi]|uniref:Uncharacterized protein n=1 Tax=Rhizobium pisi TaxID=574561 RepID=A0A7W5BSD8_9HYPH|nr:hypothetical protein [Rhizobium pisi]